MTNPFVKPPYVDKRIMPPRTALYPSASIPAGETLNNWQPEELVDGAVCFVIAEASLYRFNKFSVAAPATNVVIDTIKGTSVPGRWVVITAPSSERAYEAISYASPNSLGATGITGVLSLTQGVWTEFYTGVHAVVLNANGDLSFDGDKAIVVDRAMIAQVDWFMSYYIAGNENAFSWAGACLLNGALLQTPITGSICSDYYIPGHADAENSVMTASTVVSLDDGDTLELMVSSPNLAFTPQDTFRLQYGTLVVVELCTERPLA